MESPSYPSNREIGVIAARRAADMENPAAEAADFVPVRGWPLRRPSKNAARRSALAADR
jgi:hypothetical protein